MEKVYIKDFNDYNYVSIMFEISQVDRKQLEDKLNEDYINKMYRLNYVYERDVKLMYIENCDLQDVEIINKRYYELLFEEHYNLVHLKSDKDGLYYWI